MEARFVRTLTLCVLATLGPAGLAGQVIPVKTVPVAAGDQGLMLPSATLAMGAVTLAMDDSLADPWDNPAKGIFVSEPALLGAPTFYAISDGGGGGRTFPVAGVFRGSAWFGGVGLALQQIDNSRRQNDWIWLRPLPLPGGTERLSDASNRNLYTRAFAGTRLGESAWSVGVSVSHATLDAVDGVDLLYANAMDIRQHGTTADVRVGLYREGERDRFSALVVHDRVSMTHDVTYLDIVWDTLGWNPRAEERVEVNEDRTRTWGAEMAWDRSLAAPGWRLGTALTVNRKSHPKIPNYEIQNIPRDPGTTWAYEAGVGLSRRRGPTSFGLDVVLQPIRSETWQEAEQDMTVEGEGAGRVIRKGERTIDNDFFFTNVMLRTGFAYDAGPTTVQAGLELRSYDYRLEQRNHMTQTFRTQDESWMEWTPSLGATFRVADVELRYAGRLTTGTGRPGVVATPDAMATREMLSDFIVAPEAPLTLQDATVMTHQISARIPIR